MFVAAPYEFTRPEHCGRESTCKPSPDDSAVLIEHVEKSARKTVAFANIGQRNGECGVRTGEIETAS